jgi:ABC-2 type transport system ATP-binding protein
MMKLWEKKDQPISDFSKGMKQKVAIARALIHDPALLFFDEPTANLDPESSRVVREIILKFKKRGKRFSSTRTTWMRRNGFATASES